MTEELERHEDTGEARPEAIILSYKRVKGHPRITRIASTLAESGRDVTIIGLSETEEDQDFAVDEHVRGLGLKPFRFRLFLLRKAYGPLDRIQRWVDRLRWQR